MLVVTTDQVNGRTIKETLGLVSGSVVRTKHIGKDIMAGFRSLVGGEIKQYTAMLIESRDESIQRMVEAAELKGANAILCTRIQTAQIMDTACECIAFGTAVVLE